MRNLKGKTSPFLILKMERSYTMQNIIANGLVPLLVVKNLLVLMLRWMLKAWLKTALEKKLLIVGYARNGNRNGIPCTAMGSASPVKPSRSRRAATSTSWPESRAWRPAHPPTRPRQPATPRWWAPTWPAATSTWPRPRTSTFTAIPNPPPAHWD